MCLNKFDLYNPHILGSVFVMNPSLFLKFSWSIIKSKYLNKILFLKMTEKKYFLSMIINN